MARRGRPSVFGVAMTSTERNRRRIERLKADAAKPVGLTAEDIIAANPQYTYRPAQIGSWSGLSYIADDGVKMGVLWLGNVHVCIPAPWTPEAIEAAWHNLRSAQPGHEFKTVWDDEYAATMRAQGFAMTRDADGHACLERKAA